jgi:thiamine-phosphate pyrophosphorylase
VNHPFRLYLVTDRALSCGRSLAAVVAAAAAGGVTAVQLREKEMPEEALVRAARELLALLRPLGIPLLINDNPEAALRAGADGVHLGQSDMPAAEARRLLGPRALIGLSVESPAQAEAANLLPVDYLGLSPVFGTPTKTDTAAPLGLPGITAIRRLTRLPLVAIGGIGPGNARVVLAAGADGLAVVSAICSAADPQAAARELRVILDGTDFSS